MPVAGEARIVFAGNLPGGEQWSISHAVGGTGISTQNDLNVLVSNAIIAYSATTSLKSILQAANPAGFSVASCTGYWYTSNGPALYQARQAIGDNGSAASQPLPNQAAVVVSLLTALSGRTHRGRMYIPQLSKNLTAGQLATADVDAICTAVKNYIAALNGSVGGYSVAVASTVSAALTHVTSVRVDSKVDTQRRRAKSTAVAYSKTLTGL